VRELVLADTHLGTFGAGHLSNGVARNRHLEVLDISGCELSDVAAAHIARMLVPQGTGMTLKP
jgi:hypothetical protein